MKKKRLRKKRDGTITPRKLLDDGCYLRLSFEEKVFTALIWCGFTNSEAFGIIYPQSEATAHSQAVMAGRLSCAPAVKRYIEELNNAMDRCDLFFRGQRFKIGERAVDEAIDNYKTELREREEREQDEKQKHKNIQ